MPTHFFKQQMQTSRPAVELALIRQTRKFDGPYLVLRGLSAIFKTVATLSFLLLYPFPRQEGTYE